MEPAVGRREHQVAAGDASSARQVPQWSPPLNGGSTGRPCIGLTPPRSSRNGARRWTAGARPYGEPPLSERLVAAMEPAVERREHAARRCAVSDRGDMPQWSPPLNGGSTACTLTCVSRPDHAPQWSPPLNGGSTTVARAWSAARSAAAMEPAVERREHRRRPAPARGRRDGPQWSPPLNGGSTARRIPGRLTCADRSSCERSVEGMAPGPAQMDLSRYKNAR